MKPGDVVEVEAEALAFGGGGTVARAPDGRVVFAGYLAPGDRARVKVTQVRPAYARARPLSLVAPGPDRVAPPCPVFGECGGCQWQHVSLAAQRAAKERIVRRMLEPHGCAAAVEPIRGTGDGYAYRNRIVLPVRAGKDGRLRAGFFHADSHRLVEIGDCPVQVPALRAAAAMATALAREAGVAGYDEGLDTGVLRHLLARETSTGEIGVVFVTATAEFTRGEEIAAELVRRVPGVAGVVQNVNPGRTNVVLGPGTRVLAGRAWLSERVAGLDLRASLPAFFQANHAVAGIMAGLVGEWAAGSGGGVLDLYSGVGVLGFAAAAASRPPWLAGVDESAAAIEDAVANAKENAGALPGTETEWHAGSVEDVLPGLAARLGSPGCVIVDPPRKGLSPAALAAVLALRAPVCIYVSCDPATFARDLGGFLAAGWRADRVVPLDMFPQTWHIELAARLSRMDQ